MTSSLSLCAGVQRDYFSDPKALSSDQLEELNECTLDMCWHFGYDSHLRFVTTVSEVYFEVILGDLPDRYQDFVARVRGKLIELPDTAQLAFSYRIQDGDSEEVNVLRPARERVHPDEYSYIVSDRRIFENASPSHLSEGQLAEVIKNDAVLFYTGAGLSIASGIPAMNGLCTLLGLDESETFLFGLEEAVNHPREFASKILFFHHACVFAPPTQAHFALKELAIFKNIRIITENLDRLHERTGIDPYRVNAKELREEIGGEALAHIDSIICMGLSFDDRGFLGWYKEQNPNGRIIAIDLKQPSYLGDEDFLVVGDLQEIVPALVNHILH